MTRRPVRLTQLGRDWLWALRFVTALMLGLALVGTVGGMS